MSHWGMVCMERAIRNEINEKSLEKKYAMFLEEYGKYFTEYELWRLNGIYKMGLECIDLVDIVREIYDMFDLIKPEKNIFLGFIDCIIIFITSLSLYDETKKLDEKASKYLLPYIFFSLFAVILSLTIYFMNFN